MQLLKAKLSGFKSFVDPTVIETPSKLVAIVGPNGCGKSNIIDAITWVMGESSPKYLRGESLTDVIFNGSHARKQVGQASVELIFDNSDGTIGGEYARFAEISIKRVIDRDSDSTYYLNGTRCRKRDMVDIFLHTGLGARSYTIIGQNTIMEMAEAKPDQLRAHLERAAGISKYKERRHETELRMLRTQENLARVNDLRTELEKQLSKLKYQANVAEKFKILKEEERQLKAELYAVQWRSLDTQMTEHALQIQREETALQAKHSELSAADVEIEQAHDSQRDANQTFQTIQHRYYTIGNDITRLEQEILHQKEREQQWQQELSQTDTEWQAMLAELDQASKELQTLEQALQTLEPDYEVANQAAKALQLELNQAENAVQTWQNRWDEFNQQTANMNQLAQVEKNRSEYLDQKINGLNRRLAQLDQDSSQFDFDKLQTELLTLTEERDSIKTKLTEQQTALNNLRQAISKEQVAERIASSDLDKCRSELQQLRGQQASLQALQQTALGQRDQRLSPWINKHQLHNKTRLAQHIKVEAGWELAVEKVLGLTLQAICIDALTEVTPHLQEFTQGNLCLFAGEPQQTMSQTAHASALLNKVKSELPIAGLLAGVYVADSLHDALILIKQLADNESVVTRDGIWLSQRWLKVLREEDPAAGVFQREQELKELAKCIALLEKKQIELDADIKERRERREAQEIERDRAQQNGNHIQAELSQLEAQSKVKQDSLQAMQRQAQKIATEQQECKNNLLHAEQELAQACATLSKARHDLETLNAARDQLLGDRDKARGELQTMREMAQQKTELSHQLAMQYQSKRSQQAVLSQNKNRFETQLQMLITRKQKLACDLNALSPINTLQDTLKEALDQHASIEEELQTAREVIEGLNHAGRALEQKRQAAERDINNIRSQLENLRVTWQGWKVKADTILEQLQETATPLEAVLQQLPENITVESWQAKVEQTAQRINRLGAINLVAIDEYATCLERKEYLDKQLDDLQSGLKILEDAIAKIDKETRARFKDTFDKVNARFQELFPTIFGGGKAYLELTTDNLLDAGVGMMACPPGKRNSTVQLLSGGEKSLTAIALIFSIFHLNPAPFCLLDEVDAALDDVNVLRYARIVKMMADKTQFVFISHNKIAIEMADHLIGVTMNEPGVSRLVSVDIEKAISMVEA